MCLSLVEYIPYKVSVKASTSAGTGNNTEIIAFTKQGGIIYTSNY